MGNNFLKTIIQPQYVVPAWAYCAETHLKRLQAVENVGLRVATGTLWFIRNDDIYRALQFTRFCEVIAKRGIVVFQGAETNDKPLIREAVDYNLDDTPRHKWLRFQLRDA